MKNIFIFNSYLFNYSGYYLLSCLVNLENAYWKYTTWKYRSYKKCIKIKPK